MQAAGFLLAGGLSSRMGQNKALLRRNGETLAETGLRKLSQVCTEVAIAGGDPELALFGRLIPDTTQRAGPLGGLVSALEQSIFEWNLFLAVDVPLVPVSALRTLLVHSGGPEVAILAEAEGRAHPLCGVYSRRALSTLRAELLAGRYRVRAAIEAAGPVRYLPFDHPDWFRNVNTPEEFQALPSELENEAP